MSDDTLCNPPCGHKYSQHEPDHLECEVPGCLCKLFDCAPEQHLSQTCAACKRTGASTQGPTGLWFHHRCRPRRRSKICAVCLKKIRGVVRYWFDPDDKWPVHRKCRPIPARE